MTITTGGTTSATEDIIKAGTYYLGFDGTFGGTTITPSISIDGGTTFTSIYVDSSTALTATAEYNVAVKLPVCKIRASASGSGTIAVTVSTLPVDLG
jgi:hypothetical protein